MGWHAANSMAHALLHARFQMPLSRRVRELGFFSVVISGDTDVERVTKVAPKAIFLSGGPNSVHEGGCPTLPDGFFEYTTAANIPVLGICYGMQLMTHLLGGKVEVAPDGGEFGSMPIIIESGSTLFAHETTFEQTVWMSHGDNATKLPTGFKCVAKSKQGATVAIEDTQRKLFGLQFHPEVVHTQRGLEMLCNFLTGIAGAPSSAPSFTPLCEE
jgi:GMP synthase (glutamine-hydrolysing)